MTKGGKNRGEVLQELLLENLNIAKFAENFESI